MARHAAHRAGEAERSLVWLRYGSREMRMDETKDKPEVHNPHVIGLTGSFGSGCSFLGQHILARKGYELMSLSKVLKGRFQRATGKDPDKATRKELQDFGDSERADPEKGVAVYANEAIASICAAGRPHAKWAIDSIRNPEEAKAFHAFTRRFFLFGIFADSDVRWSRVRERYGKDRNVFEEDDRRDTGRESPPHGQRVEDSFYFADVVLANNRHFEAVGNDEFNAFAGRVGRYVDLVADPLKRQEPTPHEALMAAAYSVSQRSSCRNRKVGAVIADGSGAIISSGYNEVPRGESPCAKKYLACFREKERAEFIIAVASAIPDLKGKEALLESIFKERFRILDLCRALHAEENAILNLAKNTPAVPLSQCTLYTTTYPCRQCANKIATTGIKNLIYVEPYPDQTGKLILSSAGVCEEFFEGVTFQAYFRIFGESR